MKQRKLLLGTTITMLATSLSIVACGGGNTSSPASSNNSSNNNSSEATSSTSNSSTEANNTYSITKTYTDENKAEIPEDAVNKVMFAYSDDVNVTFKTELTLDVEAKTYLLYKAIETPPTQTTDTGEKVPTVKAEYKFNGAYTVSGNDYTLAVPTSGQASIFYPTVLNYNSLEKQTSGWVDMETNPVYKTRFNDWYPAKMEEIKDQKVTIEGTTMTFEGHEIKKEGEGEGGETGEKTAVITVTGEQQSTLTFNTDFSYTWEKEAGGNKLSENGTWALNDVNEIILTCGDGINKSTLNTEDNSQTLEYIPHTMGGYAESLKDTFTMSVGTWGQLTLVKAKTAKLTGTGEQGST